MAKEGIIHTPFEDYMDYIKINKYDFKEVIRLRQALKEIIEQCPNPKLPYGCAVVDIAKKALSIKTDET